ncbi:MAG: DUF4390 domain-containing protein [Halofilum sp. (in: g-proteobacteria)]|nr:DUF4390 domain-containing protein [Halofilum sp. (in: g-proteobacteria)]
MRACSAAPDGPAGRRPPAATRRRRGAGVLLALLLPALPAAGTADDDTPASAFELQRASVRVVDDVYRLDAAARLRLPPAVREALDNGVDLGIAWEIQIDRRNAWWPDTDVAFLTQRYRLSLHELSLQYVVTNRNTGQRRSYTRLQSALDHIGTLVRFPLVDRMLIESGGDYAGYVRVRLLHDELPLPLRAAALFAEAWDLETEWYRWTFD